MTDEELKELILYLWSVTVDPKTAATICHKKGVSAEQFKRVTDIMLCEKHGIKGDYEE